jgi:5'-3' exonuclease
MSVRIWIFGLAMTGMAGGPALAQSCGSAPIAPALPSVTQINQKSPADAGAAKHDAFIEIKRWQDELKTYRACMTNVSTQDKQKMSQADPKKDADKIKSMQDEIANANHEYDASVDMEERVANEFHAVQAAFCARPDTDKSSCPK